MALVYASITAAAPPAPAEKADVERGKQIASTVCVACHGADGNSAIPANPILAGQHGGYIAAQLAAFKSGARPSPIMQGMAASLTPEDMVNVGAYFERQKATPQVSRDKARAARAQNIWRAGIKSAGVPACAAATAPRATEFRRSIRASRGNMPTSRWAGSRPTPRAHAPIR